MDWGKGTPSKLRISEIVVDDKGQKRRKSSVSSATSDGGRRRSILDSLVGAFRKRRSASGKEESAVHDGRG